MYQKEMDTGRQILSSSWRQNKCEDTKGSITIRKIITITIKKKKALIILIGMTASKRKMISKRGT
jgi:hypothetical protein